MFEAKAIVCIFDSFIWSFFPKKNVTLCKSAVCANAKHGTSTPKNVEQNTQSIILLLYDNLELRKRRIHGFSYESSVMHKYCHKMKSKLKWWLANERCIYTNAFEARIILMPPLYVDCHILCTVCICTRYVVTFICIRKIHQKMKMDSNLHFNGGHLDFRFLYFTILAEMILMAKVMLLEGLRRAVATRV